MVTRNGLRNGWIDYYLGAFFGLVRNMSYKNGFFIYFFYDVVT